MTTADINTACSHISKGPAMTDSIELQRWRNEGKAPYGSCPFCASRISMIERNGRFRARCSHRGCGATGPLMTSITRAADLFCCPPQRTAGGMAVDDVSAELDTPRDATADAAQPPPAGRTAPRIIAERRPVYTVKIGKRNRRFSTKGAAYYALAKRLLVVKYMGPLATAGHSTKLKITTEELAAQTGLDADAIRARGERAVEMFITDERFDGGAFVDSDGYFDTGKWQAYVRRVAKKLRALDEYADKKRKEQP